MAKCEDCNEQYSGFWSVFSSARSVEENYINDLEKSFKTLVSMGVKERPFPSYPRSICTDCLQKRNTKTRSLLESINRSFVGVQRGDYVRGHKTRDIGWIRINRVDSPSDFEAKARTLAVLCGAIALIKSSWVKESETYVKGHGKKGNPHYGTRHYFRGEALAVKSLPSDASKVPNGEIQGEAKSLSVAKGTLSGITPKLVVLDASNIAREAPPNVKRIECIARGLRSANLKFIFLFDANFSHVFKLDRDSNKFMKALGLEPGEGSVVPSGSRADDFIIQFGERDGSMVITNDLFRDQPERVKNLNSNGKISKFLVFGDSVLIPDLNLDVSIA